ncbi:hypothetical protein BDR03DRAFT_84902 [Suillus americanus]|nr:hypothetical protein BDR03DRAFT_84902 [Suillus americanus]
MSSIEVNRNHMNPCQMRSTVHFGRITLQRFQQPATRCSIVRGTFTHSSHAEWRIGTEQRNRSLVIIGRCGWKSGGVKNYEPSPEVNRFSCGKNNDAVRGTHNSPKRKSGGPKGGPKVRARVFVEADIRHQGTFGAEVGRRQHEFMTKCIVS